MPRGRARLRGASSGGLGRLMDKDPQVQLLDDLGHPWEQERKYMRRVQVDRHVHGAHKDEPQTDCPLCAQQAVPLTMSLEQAALFVELAANAHPETLLVEDGGYDQEESYVEHYSVDRDALALMVLTAYRAGRRDGWAMSRYRRMQRLRRAAR